VIAAPHDAAGRRSFRYGPACIDVATADLDAVRWLEEFLTPWFASGPPADGPLAVRLTSSASDVAALEREQATAALLPLPCFALDRELVELPGWARGDETVIADRERSCFYRVRRGSVEIVAQPGVRRARVALLRVVRELAAARVLEQAGILDLHAAACVVAERGVLLVGPKRSGKTTLLVDALASGRASLVANDRVFVDTRQTPGRAFGVPTLVSLRTGTLRWFPSLPQGLPERPALLNAAELAAQAGAAPVAAPAAGMPLHLSLSPAQLANRLGAGVAACAPLAAIVFPEISAATSSWSLEAVSREDGASWLRESLYGIAAGPRPRTIFEEAALGPSRRQPPRLSLVDRLASRIPLFRCRLGRHAYRDGAGAWLRELPLAPARKRRIA
jgi:hypothetical protein